MAIYHLRLKVIGRKLGRAPLPGGATFRSAVAAAAYRAGERLYDIAQGKWFHYEKDHVLHSEILVPDMASLGPWVRDREALWNMVQSGECTSKGVPRDNAQYAREIEISLPRELTLEQNVTLVRDFLRRHFVSQGMIADFSIHSPEAADGKSQPHAHVLVTMRRLDPASPTGFAKTKERDWNEREDVARACAEARKRYNDTGLPEDKEALEAAEAMRNVNVWRKAWAEHANQALADAGSEARIDHRTLEKQGIFRPAEIALGVARHIEKAYTHLKDRVTQWVAVKKRQALYDEVAHYKTRDPVALAELLLRLTDMAESFATQFRRPTDRPRDTSHER